MIMLYVEFLFYETSRRTRHLIEYADQLRDSGKLSKNRLVVPGVKRIRKWFSHALHQQDLHDDDYSEGLTVQLGEAYNKRKDPEHLPPQNAWEKSTTVFRTIAHFFASPASAFGFRVACATMSIAIISYLRDTQVFFTTQRLFWAEVRSFFTRNDKPSSYLVSSYSYLDSLT